jgi:integrase
VAKVGDGLSMAFTAGRWIARFRTLEGVWSSKRLPEHLLQREDDQARRWIVAWYAQYLRDGGVQPQAAEVRPSTRVTLTDIFTRWSEYRRSDPGTDPGYARALVSQFAMWISPHEIAQLDVRTELGPLQIVTWIRSLQGAPSTRLTIASTLSVMLTDTILHGRAWGVDPAMVHPMIASPHVVRELDALRASKRAEKVTPIFEPHEVETLLTSRNSKVWDVRRVKYALWLSTGMRERELQGLTWADIKELPTPHVWVLRQLVKGGPAPFLLLADVRREHGPKVDLTTIEQAIVKAPKRSSRRALPLLPLIVDVLSWWRATGWQQFAGRQPTEEDPIFPSGFRNRHQPHGQFCTPDAGALLLDDLDRLGINRLYTSPKNGLKAEHTSRTFRHTFASTLSDVGVDDGRIGDVLGHSASSVTRAYYIEALLSSRAEVVSKLRLPDRVVLRAHEVRDPSRAETAEGKVLPMRQPKSNPRR